MTITTAELAEIIDITLRQIQNLVKDGIIPRISHGTFDAKEAVGAFINYRINGSSPIPDLKIAQTQKELTLVKLNELKISEKEGELISVEQLATALSAISKTLSNKLYSLVPKIGRELELDSTTKQTIESALDEILTELKEPLEYETFMQSI